ncbi:FAD-dependent monooxygenase [Actinoplanes sp. NPDC051513]|uniref:FAD-dependent monooxygenase n=1 Tax=Actinoplanes sp. NPDC051513 TaxID=3363908 RepID=UPI0037B7AC13
MTYRRIAVVGAGIGGLTAAVGLARRGARCVVFERHRGIPEDGTGIQISPNAAAGLYGLGLEAAFATAVRPAGREIRRWRDDTVLGRTDLTRHEVPYFTMRRAALVRALLDAVRREQGPDAVRFGRRCIGVRDEGDHVLVGFEDGTVTTADLVIGADGLRSAVGGAFRPDPPRYSGHVACRAVLPMEAARGLAEPDRVVVWLGPDRHCVAYPIDGGRYLNLVVTTPADQPTAASTVVSAASLLGEYRGWHPAVRGLIGLARQLGRWPLYDRAPAPAPWRGRVALIGDAAHPMLPFLAQGAAQAIEDAVALAGCLHRPDGPGRFAAERLPRVRRVAEASHAGLRAYHLPDGTEQRRRDRAMTAARPEALDWLYGSPVRV